LSNPDTGKPSETDHLPRTLVARALRVEDDVLPPGDLPLGRFAHRVLSYLKAGDEDTPPPPDHPDGWTLSLFDALTRDHPALALAACRAVLDSCESPEDVALVAAGPLEDLILAQGAALIDEIERLAARSPRFAYALTGVWPPEAAGGLLWARIDAARRDIPGLDDGAPLPPPDGRV